jgi:hypothetical protein
MKCALCDEPAVYIRDDYGTCDKHAPYAISALAQLGELPAHGWSLAEPKPIEEQS